MYNYVTYKLTGVINMKKKVLSLFLCICLLAGMCFFKESAYAEEEQNVDVQAEEQVEAKDPDTTDVVTEGQIGAHEGDNSLDFSGPVQIPCMDAEGNITYITEEVSPVVEEISTFVGEGTSEKVVNFRSRRNGSTVSGLTYYTEYKTGKEEYIVGTCGADAAYLGESGGKVKFMISGTVGLVNANDVQVVNLAGTNVSYYEVYQGVIYHHISSNLNTSASSQLKVGYAQSYMKNGDKYYSYDGHYFYKDYMVMLKDYRNESRANSINPSQPYYNYYQYLPLRSSATYSGAELNSIINGKVSSSSKMRNLGESIVNAQNTYGINALIMSGIAANESAWGTSWIAQNKNNLFGLNAVDSSPGQSADTFRSPAHCVEEYANEWMSKGYLDPTDWRYYGGFLGNKGSGINVKYASDPYWGEKAANIAWNLDANAKDRDRYTIGIKDTINTSHTELNVRNGSSISSKKIFTTKNHSNHAFIILGEENGFYKVQSDPVLTSARDAIDYSTGRYNFSNMYLYASKDYIQVVQKGKDSGSGSNTGSAPVSSSVYQIDGSQKLISGIKKFPVKASDFAANIKAVNAGKSVKVQAGKNGNVGTGSKVLVYDAGGKLLETYQVVIYGETNGDGIVNALDLLRTQKDILGVKKLSGLEKTAADSSRNGKVDSLDLLKIKKQIIGAKEINQ